MQPDCDFFGPSLTPGFATNALPALLTRLGLYPRDAEQGWRSIQRGLQTFAAAGGPMRVLHHIIQPLAAALGYAEARREEAIPTREGAEDGGYSLRSPTEAILRVWPVGSGIDLDSPMKRGPEARISPSRRAGRVLRTCGETTGIVTNGAALRLLLRDPAGSDSFVHVALTGRAGWATRPDIPESYRLIFALASPAGVAAASEIFDAARLHQTEVTKTLRTQARAAIEDFLRCVLERNVIANVNAAMLWRQALTVVYRLLFILKLESSAEPGGGFSFAASETWRRGFSPNRGLGPLVRRHLDLGHDTGRLLEDGLRILFQVCREGLRHSTLSIAPLGGGLFDPATTELLDGLHWGERAVALMLDRLLWTTPRGRPRERVHYGPLGVEELGRIYESLLDLEPEIATEPMVRARRGRLETVVPATRCAEGIEAIPAGRFYLRTGLGRRTGGSYYTPHAFVRFLVSEALTPLVRPGIENADPESILRIKVIDPAMGSGHFLVEACRFLAEALYEASRRRDQANVRTDPDGVLACWLPSRCADPAESGLSRTRALAICRRLIAVHCLYGIDLDPLAVELAKLSLWLESFAEGLPLTFLDHRLLAGDSISGPFFRDLTRLPVGGRELDPLLARGISETLRESLDLVMAEVRQLEVSIGTTLGEIMAKQAAKKRLDSLLAPLRGLARAWSGAVRTQAREANDAWLALARAVADTGALPENADQHQAALLTHGETALSLDLTFPEVFQNGGFHAVLGNPPWDVVHYQTKEYLAGFDPRVMDVPTKRERAAIERELLADPLIATGFRIYKNEFVERKRLCDRLFATGANAGSIDLFQVFADRMLDCVAPGGAIGLVVPSSLHANEGTQRLRRRFLDEVALECCFSFENRTKLFDVHGQQKFTLLIARGGARTESFRCAFYLNSIAQIAEPGRAMRYDRDFIAATGGACEAFLELRGQADLRIARHMFVGRTNMGTLLSEQKILFGREAHMTDDAHRFSPIGRRESKDTLTLHEGKTFHQFTDRWKAAPRYAIRPGAMRDKPAWRRAAAYYRLVFREISRGTDERTMIAAIVPPGHVFGHKATCEKAPWQRPVSSALVLCAIFNSFAFDWCPRQKIAGSVSLFMLKSCPAPTLSPAAVRFLAHGALRLACNHPGYDDLWRDQLGTAAAPIVDRSKLRAAMDAAVAHGYGLGREDYRHMLGGFSHKSNPAAPDQCLSAFDTITQRGAAAYYRRNDPFHDVALPDQPTMESARASATLMPSTPAESMPPA